MQNLEKSLKKTTRIQTVLIIVVILLLLYAIFMAGDINSAKQKAENRHSEEMAAIETEITEMEEDIAKSEENIAKYEAENAEYQAIIDAVKDGTYVAE